VSGPHGESPRFLPPPSKAGSSGAHEERIGPRGASDTRSRSGSPSGRGLFGPVEFRNSRLARLRATAPPARCPGGDADLAFSPTQGIAVHRIMRRVHARPFRTTSRNPGRCAAFVAGKLRGRSRGNGHFLPLTVTERRLPPLAPRRDMTFRRQGSTSARGTVRSFRRRLCGWYVRFMGTSLLPSTRLAQMTGKHIIYCLTEHRVNRFSGTTNRVGEETLVFRENTRNLPATMIPRFELRRLFGLPSCRQGRGDAPPRWRASSSST